MQDPDFISLFVAPLESVGINYMITGSVASSVYGEPRNTLDIDLVVLIQPDQIPLLPQLFPENDFYLPPSDVVAIESRREAHGHFNIIHHHTGLKADIYLSRNHPTMGACTYPPHPNEHLRNHPRPSRIRHSPQTRFLPGIGTPAPSSRHRRHDRTTGTRPRILKHLHPKPRSRTSMAGRQKALF